MITGHFEGLTEIKCKHAASHSVTMGDSRIIKSGASISVLKNREKRDLEQTTKGHVKLSN